jgi:phosphoribosylamine-glycine ligase
MRESMSQFPEELRHELDQSQRICDPNTQTVYVLVREDVVARIQALLKTRANEIRITAEHLDRVMGEDDALDPHLAEYQQRYGGRL